MARMASPHTQTIATEMADLKADISAQRQNNAPDEQAIVTLPRPGESELVLFA
jgi:hypothetical protein